MIEAKTIEEVMKKARFREAYNELPKGKTYQDLSTVLVLPIPGNKIEKKKIVCKCKREHVYEQNIISGLDPQFVMAWKNYLLKPMNVPFVELPVVGLEVGEAYNTAIEQILNSPGLKGFKYLLTLEYDNIIPVISPELPTGALMPLYDQMDKYDAVGGLYWTKGEYSLPLIYGNPKEGRKSTKGMFKVRNDFKFGEVVECNGMGMGFTLFKMELFRDERLGSIKRDKKGQWVKPFFKTANEFVTETEKPGLKSYTQDLYFFEKFRQAGYRCAVHTGVRLGHKDLRSGVIY